MRVVSGSLERSDHAANEENGDLTALWRESHRDRSRSERVSPRVEDYQLLPERPAAEATGAKDVVDASDANLRFISAPAERERLVLQCPCSATLSHV